MKAIFLIIALLATSLAHAENQQSADWQLVGEARLKVLFWPVYEARLHTLDGEYDNQKRPVKLELTYLRDIKAEALLDKTEDEWKNLGVSNQHIYNWIPLLQEIWTDIEKNDSLAVIVSNKGHSHFHKNGEHIGGIQDPIFSKAFLDIWLSPKTSQPENRLALIGKAEE